MIQHPNGFFSSGGGLAMLDAQGLLVRNEAAIQTNANALRHDEGVLYDREMMAIGTKRLTISNWMQGKGLVKNLGTLGVILSMYQRSGDYTPANISMSGRTRATQDGLTFDEVGVPIPIFHKEFEIDHRRLAMSRLINQPIDTDNIAAATRVVAQEWESHLFAGTPSIVIGGQTCYGFITHPNRNTLSVTAAWSGTTAANILLDIKRMAQALIDDYFYGPFDVMVASDLWLKLSEDYSANKGDNTILDRIKANPYINDVVPADYLTAGNIVMFQSDREVVDLAMAQDMDNIPWQTQPFQTEYKVFMAGAIRVKSKYDGKCGVVHAS